MALSGVSVSTLHQDAGCLHLMCEPLHLFWVSLFLPRPLRAPTPTFSLSVSLGRGHLLQASVWGGREEEKTAGKDGEEAWDSSRL